MKEKMIKNYYYLIVGILTILFSLTHAWNGKEYFLPITDASDLGIPIKTTIFYVWHILSAENLIFGAVFLVMSVHKDLSKVRFTAWMIVFIMIARWIVVFSSTLFKNKNGITDILIDSTAIVIMIVLIILGINKTKN